jgi:hypothetical protein
MGRDHRVLGHCGAHFESFQGFDLVCHSQILPHTQMSLVSSRSVRFPCAIARQILTIFTAIKIHSAILVLLMIGIQLIALVWYSLSYIPYARDMVWSCVKRMTGL